MSVAFNGDGTGIAVGLEGIILRSSDAGKTWENHRDAKTTEHLFSVIHHGDQWVCAGNQGIIVTASGKGDVWEARQLSSTELLWHTEVVPLSDKLIIVGGSQGIYENGRWSYLFRKV
jgi:photosystem II stability/assembly factor-like uncharacterized protein